MKLIKDILVLHVEGAHEVLEESEGESVMKTFESKPTILLKSQQEKDGDLETQEWQDHSGHRQNNKYVIKQDGNEALR